MSRGWICLQRGWRENDIFDREFSRGEAWIWLVENACWRETTQKIKGKTVLIKRGQFCTSRDHLASSWGWSASAVERFLTRLVLEQMIERETGHGKSILTICNYAKFQDRKAGTEHISEYQGVPEAERLKNQQTIKQDHSVANATGAMAPSGQHFAADLVKSIFDTGVAILTTAGVNEKTARSIIGRFRKDHSDSAVIAVLSKCQTERPSAPVEWITRALQAEAQRSGSGVRTRPDGRMQLPSSGFANTNYYLGIRKDGSF